MYVVAPLAARGLKYVMTTMYVNHQQWAGRRNIICVCLFFYIINIITLCKIFHAIYLRLSQFVMLIGGDAAPSYIIIIMAPQGPIILIITTARAGATYSA